MGIFDVSRFVPLTISYWKEGIAVTNAFALRGTQLTIPSMDWPHGILK